MPTLFAAFNPRTTLFAAVEDKISLVIAWVEFVIEFNPAKFASFSWIADVAAEKDRVSLPAPPTRVDLARVKELTDEKL
jgi:hypothetical protein